jgi:RHS repeat-associated protein
VYRFSSKELLTTCSLYYYGYRFYDPNLQRGPNRDPLGELGFEATRNAAESVLGGEPNRFAFVFNNPYGFIDSDGLSGTIAIPVPIEIPPIPIPVWAPPVAAGAVGFGAGWMAGTWLNDHTFFGNIADWVCPVHTPGRDHDTKSGPQKKRRFQEQAAKNRQQAKEDLIKQWDVWNGLPDAVKKLRPELKPSKPDPRIQ